MKPVSYQSMPPSVSGAHPSLPLDPVINTSNVMYCEKCRFASTDAAAFKKHMVEHFGTRFYCFYCNGVSFSETELNAHLKQHTYKYRFKCPHCGQGYMRRLCLMKHIERLHSKSISQVPTKAGIPKHLHVPVSSALSSVPVANLVPPPPPVRITVPTPSRPPFRLGKDEGKGKTLATSVSNAANRNADHLSPLNGLIQHNRALTVSLPEEVSIPAGCLVELVEVKTVNGTKELKLRLVTQQENESGIKDTRTTVSQSSALGKPLSSALNHPNNMSSRSMGMCAPKRKQIETNSMNMERTAAVSGTIPKSIPNQVSKEKAGFKRTSEVINLECNIPSKLPKCILNLVRDGNPGIRITPREPVTLNAPAPAPAVVTTRITNRVTSSLHPDNMGIVNLIPELSKSIPPPRRASDTKSIPREGALPVKLEPGEVNVRSNAALEIKKETPGSNQPSLTSASPSLNVSAAADAQPRPPALLVCKDSAAAPNLPFPAHRTVSDQSSVKTPAHPNHTNSSIVSWPSEVRPRERARDKEKPEPESFPVISSVFSLSQQPEEVQGSFQPLVMALRGIVMDKNSMSDSPAQSNVNITNSKEETKEEPKAEYRPEVAPKSTSVTCDRLEEQTKDRMKVEEHEKGVQHPPVTPNPVHIKEEANTKTTTSTTCSPTSASESSRDVESASTKASAADVPVAAASPQPVARSDRDVYSSKFPTVSLKRVQMGVWKQSSIGLKLRISKYKTRVPVASVADCTVLYPMPLKVNQLVKRPGPNQPVVVLNHPKPRAPVQGVTADSVADTGASTMVPKCQILKMRLSKVMGQKYEVMGCTVRVFP